MIIGLSKILEKIVACCLNSHTVLLSSFCFIDICHIKLSNVKINQSINQIYSDPKLSLSCFYMHCDSLRRLVSSSHALLCFQYCHVASALYAPFSLSLSLAWRDPGFCSNHPDRVLACYYNNSLAIPHALVPSLASVPSLFLCGNRKMRSPPRVQVDFDFTLLLLLAEDVSRKPVALVRMASVSEL